MSVSSGRLEVTTADHVVLHYDLAGPGTRGAAALIDTLVSLLMVVGLTVLAVIIGSRLPPAIGVQLVGLTGFAILICWTSYFVLLEWLWNGQTVGKRRAGLRVIGTDGEPARFMAVLIRNLLRPIDFLPGVYGLGVTAMFLTPGSQRLGDLAAGTYVVRAPKLRLDWLSLRTLDRAAAGAVPVAEAGASVRISGESQRIVREFIARELTLKPAERARIARVIAGPLRTSLPEIDATDDVVFLHRVAAALRAAGDGETGRPA